MGNILLPKQHWHPDAMLTQSWPYWRSPDTDLQHCCKIAWILRGNFAHHILHDSITSILHQVCVASSIIYPVQQHHLNVASSLCRKFYNLSCPAASPQYCIKFVFQAPFYILSSSITSMLYQVCVASSIIHPVQQYHLNIASSLCCKSYFSSYPAASPQYYIKFAL